MNTNFTSKVIVDVLKENATVIDLCREIEDYTSIVHIDISCKEQSLKPIPKPLLDQNPIRKQVVLRKCSAKECNNSNVDCELFQFPLVFKYVNKQKVLNISELWRCREWVKVSGNSTLLQVDPRHLHQTNYLCSEHFDSSQFNFDSKGKILHRNAVPRYTSSQVIEEELMKVYDLKWNPMACEEEIQEKSNGKCCVAKCKYKSGDTLFSFPKVSAASKGQQLLQDDDFNRCMIWLQASGNKQLLQIHPSLMHKRKKMCVQHFDADQLYQSKKRLKGKAVPSKGLPQPINENEIEAYKLNFIEMVHSSNSNSDNNEGNLHKIMQKCSQADAKHVHKKIFLHSENATQQNYSQMESAEKFGKEINLRTESEPEEDIADFLQVVMDNHEGAQASEGNKVIETISHGRKIGRKCCALNCKNDHQSNLTFFHLPNVVHYKRSVRCIHDTNYHRFMEWVEIIGNPKLIEADPQTVYKKYMICSDHFHHSCFTNKFKKRLRKDAIPTTLLSSTPLSKKLMDDYKTKFECWKDLMSDPSFNLSLPFSSDELFAKTFEDEMRNLKLQICEECKEISLVSDNHKRCTHHGYCWQFSDKNNMDPGLIPDELKDLSFTEESLIARIHPMISVFKLKGHQYGYRGNVINFCQDVAKFAKTLPHNVNDLSSIINVKYKDRQTNIHDFFVRSGKVRAALIWLKENNPFYKDIEISEENIKILPEQGNVVENLHSFPKNEDAAEESNEDFDDDDDSENDEDSNEDDDEEREPAKNKIHESFLPNIHVPDQETLIRNQLSWPKLAEEPVDEYNTPGYIACAFPTLFPYGKADLRDLREHEIKPGMYFKHLMLYHDERFAKHQTFRFFAYNSLQRWTAISDGNVFIKNNPSYKNMTKDKLKTLVQDNPNILKKIMHQGSNIRGTKAFWHARSSELQDMVTQLGLPTIFLTLSCADGHWSDLYRILRKEDDVSQLSEKERRKLIQDNPHIVDMFFSHRVETFITQVLEKKYEVKDYWYRIEYQHRGSPHIHGIFWIKDAPDVSNLENETEEKLNEVMDYFSKLITAINPDRHCSESDYHPCRKHYSQIVDFQEDLAQLLNKVQRHTRCSKDYCLKFNKVSKKINCRFKFPMDLQEEARLKKSETSNECEFDPERNDPLLNKYNQFIIQLWRANIDIAPVISKKALVAYLTKYISKCEVQSKALDQMLGEIINSMTEESLAVSAIRRLFVRSCAERDISAQEVCHTLLGLKLYSAGKRRFVVVNFNANDWLKVEEDDTEKFGTNFIEKYQKRPAKYEHVTLWQAAKCYTLPNWHSVQKENIVRVFPRIKLNPNKENCEPYYRQKVLLHVPWRNEENILTDDLTWEELYNNHHICNIDDSETVSLKNVNPDEEEYDIDLDDFNEDENEDFMVVSKIGPNQTIEKVPLGNRDIDINYDWNKSLEMYEKYGTLNELASFIETQKKNNQNNPINELDPEIPLVQFSQDQQSVINVINSQIDRIKGIPSNDSIPKRIVVQGKAGTGKSLVIKYITAKVHQNLGKDSYMIGAPTGAAALLINGKTLHSMFRIPKKVSQFKPLKGESALKLSSNFKNVKFLILDEYSLIGCNTLGMIDLRCKQATGNYDEDFGGLHVFLFGDIKQLPPVKDSPVYSKTQRTTMAKHGKLIFGNIQKAFILQTCHRQQDQAFLGVLDNISDGTVTISDYELLSTRFKHNLSVEETRNFKDAIRLFTTKAEVTDYNIKRLSEERDDTGSAVPIARILARHNNQMAKQGTIDDANGLASEIFLSKGCRIMLRKNLWVSHGLVNGALGKVVDILYEKDQDPRQEAPKIILCEFEDYDGPALIPETKVIPIAPVLSTWESKDNDNCSRWQFPISLAYACSVHKSQGMTLNKAVINIASEFAVGLAYVALSRVKSLHSLIIDPFPHARLLNIGKSDSSKTTMKLRCDLINHLSNRI